MKHVSNINRNNPFKNVIKPAAYALLFLLLTSSNSKAADITKPTPVEVSYVGSDNYSPIFLIEFDNEAEEEIYLTLKNEMGYVIYSERVKDKRFSKRFMLEGAELSNIKLKLTLRTKNGTEEFEISRSTREVEEISVAKVH